MKRLALFALAMFLFAAPSCAGAFDKCVKPVASQLTWTGAATELADVVAQFLLCDGGLNAATAPACALTDLEDLATSLGPDGKQVVDCLVAYYQTNGSATLQARAKVVGAKRGTNVSKLECHALALLTPVDRTTLAPPASCPMPGSMLIGLSPEDGRAICSVPTAAR